MLMTLGSGLNVAVVYAQLRYMDPASVNPLGASRYQELRRRRAHKSSLQHRHLCAPAPLFSSLLLRLLLLLLRLLLLRYRSIPAF